MSTFKRSAIYSYKRHSQTKAHFYIDLSHLDFTQKDEQPHFQTERKQQFETPFDTSDQYRETALICLRGNYSNWRVATGLVLAIFAIQQLRR